MAKKKTADEPEEFKFKKTAVRWQYVTQIVLSLIRTAGVVLFMYLVYRTVESLAGRQTAADISFSGGIDLKFLASRYASQIIFFFFGSGGILYGISQKSLYKKTVAKLKRLQKYEQTQDPNRTSSGLEHGSKPNLEDTL